MKKITLSLFTVTALLLGAATVSAQTVPEPVQYIIAPENPAPNSPVYIEAQGVGNFLGNAQMSWSVNGKVVSSGTGARTFSFVTGALGSPTKVTLTINSSQYGTITHIFTFSPSLINLVWEADTSVPPFYMGKALASSGSLVRVIAFPVVQVGGTRQNPSTLSYQWSLDDQPAPAQSGLGRTTFSFNANELHSGATVDVDVLSGTQTVGHAEIAIPFASPGILFYTKDPLRGVLYNRALVGTFAMPTEESTLHAEPFFFSNDSLANGSLQYAWQLNGNDTSGPHSAQGELTLRQVGQGAGGANVQVSLQNSDVSKLLQAAQSTLIVTFGGANASFFNSFFGI